MRAPRGQAAVETALTMPLVIFLVLGTLQLFLLLQARIVSQYAAYQAARVGSVSQGRCDAMTHAELLALLPALRSFMGPGATGSPGQRLGQAFAAFRDNHFGNYRGWPASDAVLWLVRESPRFPGTDPVRATRAFDLPLDAGAEPVRLELRLIVWCPLQVPFADWVFSRMALAHYALMSYRAQDPLMLAKRAAWRPGSRRLGAEIASEYLGRVAAGRYVFPIDVSATMRMMSPVKLGDFATPNCGTTPSTL